MTLFQKLSNWLFGTPPIPTPTSTVERAPEPAPQPPLEKPLQEVVQPEKEVQISTLTLNVPAEWTHVNTVTVSTTELPPAPKKPRKPRAKKDTTVVAPSAEWPFSGPPTTPAAITTKNKSRKPRQKKK